MASNPPNGNGEAVPAGVIGVAPSPFSVLAGQHRWSDGKLYTVLSFHTTFGAFAVWLDGAGGLNLLGAIDPIIAATNAGLELPRGNNV